MKEELLALTTIFMSLSSFSLSRLMLLLPLWIVIIVTNGNIIEDTQCCVYID